MRRCVFITRVAVTTPEASVASEKQDPRGREQSRDVCSMDFFHNLSTYPSCQQAFRPARPRADLTQYKSSHINNTKQKPENHQRCSPLSKTLDLVEPVGRSILVARTLAPHRQAHGMPPATIRTHILQSLNVILYNLARVILDRHGGQLGCELEDRLGRERLDALAWEDGEFGHDAFGGLVADGEERGESFLFRRDFSCR